MSMLNELAAVLGEGLIADREIIDGYRRDRAAWAKAGEPLALVRPASTAEVQAIARWSTRHRVPLVPRGAGSGISGGATASDGALIVSFERMHEIVEIDPAAMLARVQPGVMNAALKTAVEEHGLWYPPDPSSYEISSIGRNVATNAGGLCCVKYGVTADYVLGLEAVLADGTVVRSGGRSRKDVAGYDLTRLLVGSEGTLALITEVTVRLRRRPLPARTLRHADRAEPDQARVRSARALELENALRGCSTLVAQLRLECCELRWWSVRSATRMPESARGDDLARGLRSCRVHVRGRQ